MNGVFSRRHCRAASQRFCVLVLACTATLAAGGCRRSAETAPGITITESLEPQPVRIGTEMVKLQLADASGQPIVHARIQIEGDMDHPGMQPVFSDAEEMGAGSYRAPLTFSMGGDWVVLAHITLADGRRAERQWDVKGVASR